jgi:site-specific recombinase XerD
MNLRSAVDEFISAKKIENLSDRTINLYASMTDELVDFVGEIPLDEFTASEIRNFLSYQQDRNGRYGKLSDATLHKYYSVIRTFSRWLANQEYKEISPMDKVRPPRVEDKLPESMTDEEVDRLFRYLKAYCSDRVTLIFAFFLDTGARLTEVVRLNVDDLHLNDGWVKVYGKGRRERILPLGRELSRSLENYLAMTRPLIAEEGEEALFVTQQGTRYTREGMSTLVKTKLQKVHVKGHYGPHKLRHTYATNYLRNGGNLEQLRIVLGHRNISTTQRYLSLLPEDLTRAQRSASPFDKAKRRMDEHSEVY